MKKKYQLTGFARLIIFLLFFLPIVYIGVSYYHGENPFEKIEHLFSKKKSDEPYISKDRFGINDQDELKDQIRSKDDEIRALNDRIKKLERKLDQLQSQSHEH